MGMVYIEYYKCNQCGTAWRHEWDTDDYNNDFTNCPHCGNFDYEEITHSEFITEQEIKQMKQPINNTDELHLRASITQRSWRNFWMGKPSIIIESDWTINTDTCISGDLVIRNNACIKVMDGVVIKVDGNVIFESGNFTVAMPNGEIKQ